MHPTPVHRPARSSRDEPSRRCRSVARTFVTAALLGTVATVAAAPSPDDRPAPGHRFVHVVDREGFERPIPATRAEVPVGWTETGGMHWRGEGCGFVAPSVNWSAASPDGASALSQLPQEAWTRIEPPMPVPCQEFDASSTRAFVAGYVARHRPGARVLDFRVNPMTTESLRAGLAQMSMSGRPVLVEVGEALLADRVGGRETREILALPLVVTLHETSTMRALQAWTLPAVAVRAPAGELDFAAAYRLGATFVDHPEWGRRMAEYRRRQAAASRPRPGSGYDPIEAQRKLGQTYSEIGDIVASTPSPAVMSDGARREQSEMILGTETWNLPHGGTVGLDSSDRAWQTNDGTLVTSDDPLLDFGLDATELERAR